jgi:hypothetical protein
MRLTLREDAPQAPTIVTLSLVLFVFLSLASMMTTARPGSFDEACLRAGPNDLMQVSITPAPPARDDQCCDDAFAVVADALQDFDFAVPRDVVVFALGVVSPRGFDARGPPGLV